MRGDKIGMALHIWNCSLCDSSRHTSSVNMDFVIYLRLDVVHKGLHTLMKALKCTTLSTCEAWQVVV